MCRTHKPTIKRAGQNKTANTYVIEIAFDQAAGCRHCYCKWPHLHGAGPLRHTFPYLIDIIDDIMYWQAIR